MQTPDFPGAARFLQCYREGMSFNAMARDPELCRTMLAGVNSERTRSFKCYYKAETLCEVGLLERRKPKRERKPKDLAQPERTSEELQAASLFEEELERYERWIGAPAKHRQPVADPDPSLAGDRRYVLIADLHVPDHRRDLIIQVAERHEGEDCIVLGDLNDYEFWGRWENHHFTPDSLRHCFAEQDATLDLLTRYFRRVTLMLGNHDRRPWQKAGRMLGPDYGWMTHEFLMAGIRHRHGVHVVDYTLEKQNLRHVENLHFFHQVGDCLLTHAECAGAPNAASAIKAHDFMSMWHEILGLKPWNVIVQAHSHKVSYNRHRVTKKHLFECGALCDIPQYALKGGRHCYGPVEHGYMLLCQSDGITDLQETRLLCLD